MCVAEAVGSAVAADAGGEGEQGGARRAGGRLTLVTRVEAQVSGHYRGGCR